MKNLKRFGPFLWMRFNCLKATKPLRGDIYFLPLSPEEFLVLVKSTSADWKAEIILILKPSSRFDSKTLDWKSSALNIWIIGKTYLILNLDAQFF